MSLKEGKTNFSILYFWGGGSNEHKPTWPPIPRSLQCAYLMPFQVTFADVAFVCGRTSGEDSAAQDATVQAVASH